MVEWWQNAHLLRLTNENDQHSHYLWNVMNRLIKETGFDGRTQRYTHDSAGRITEHIDGSAQEIKAGKRHQQPLHLGRS